MARCRSFCGIFLMLTSRPFFLKIPASLARVSGAKPVQPEMPTATLVSWAWAMPQASRANERASSFFMMASFGGWCGKKQKQGSCQSQCLQFRDLGLDRAADIAGGHQVMHGLDVAGQAAVLHHCRRYAAHQAQHAFQRRRTLQWPEELDALGGGEQLDRHDVRRVFQHRTQA